MNPETIGVRTAIDLTPIERVKVDWVIAHKYQTSQEVEWGSSVRELDFKPYGMYFNKA